MQLLNQDWRSSRDVNILVPACIAFGIVMAGMVGYTVPVDIRILGVVVLPVVLLSALLSAEARLILVVFGGIFVLQTSDGVSVLKLLYLGGCLVSAAIAASTLFSSTGSSIKRIAWPLVLMSVAWFPLLILSLGVARVNNVVFSDWVRGVLPYVLFAVVPLIAFDVAAHAKSQRTFTIIRVAFVVASLITALSWAVAWLSRRGYADLQIDHLFLWSFLFPAALFCYGFSHAIHANSRRIVWLTLCAVILVLFAITGTRSTLFFFVGPAYLLLTSGRHVVRRGFSLIVPLSLCGLVAVFLLRTAVSRLDIDTELITERFYGLLQPGSLAAVDRSVEERVQLTNLASDTFRESMLFGVSPGYRYYWSTSYGASKSGINLDTPLAFLAHFGIAGILVVIASALMLLTFMRRAGRETGGGVEIELGALKAYLVTVLASVAMGSPFEDKGFSFALMFLTTLVLVRCVEQLRSSGSEVPEMGKEFPLAGSRNVVRANE